jgi:uncharacterized membrane protein YcgQ (UPF0703/DUF1980 family)
MQTLAIILVILSALGGAVCFVMLIISLLNKNFSLRPKKILIIWSGCFAVFILSNIIGVATAPANNGSKSTTAKSEIEVKEQPKKKTEEEKAADEAKKKADEEAKAKADAEAKKAKEEADAKKAADEKVAYDTGITYNQLARTPDDYKGKKAKFTGRVIQVMEGDKETDLRIAVDGNSDTVLFVGYDPKITSTRVLENDNVTVKGKSIGIYSYQSTMGGKISIPGMLVDNIVINNK